MKLTDFIIYDLAPDIVDVIIIKDKFHIKDEKFLLSKVEVYNHGKILSVISQILTDFFQKNEDLVISGMSQAGLHTYQGIGVPCIHLHRRFPSMINFINWLDFLDKKE